MAIDQGTDTVTVVKKDRMWRAEFFVADDDSVQVRFQREIQAKNQSTGAITKDRDTIPTVARSQNDIKTKTYTVGANTLTGQQILAFVNQMSDVERQWDIDHPPT